MLFVKPLTRPRRRLWVLRHAALATTTWSFQASPLFDAPKQVQNGAVGDAEESGRADEGGEAGDGKPAAAAEIELPRPLAI